MEQQNYYNLSLGIAGGLAAKCLWHKSAKSCINNFSRIYIRNNVHGKVEYKEPLFQVLKRSGLKQDGVDIFDINRENASEVMKTVNARCKKKTKKVVIPESIKKILYRGRIKQNREGMSQVLDGYNACVMSNSSAVLINLDKLSLPGFHELGHLYKNNNLGRKILVKLKMPMIRNVVPAILLVGLLKDKKNEAEAPKNSFDKATDFIKNNCGKLTSLCFLPLLTEEAIASINAAKLAKGVLDKSMLKTMCKYNAFAWSTYLAGAALAGLTSYLGVLTRDEIVEKNFIKTQSSAS